MTRSGCATPGRELLSLAFIDARNRTLRWLTALAQFDASAVAREFDPPHWLIGHVGWFQESSIGRNVRRTRGESSIHGGLHLASIEPRADSWFDPSLTTRQQRWQRHGCQRRASARLPGRHVRRDDRAARAQRRLGYRPALLSPGALVRRPMRRDSGRAGAGRGSDARSSAGPLAQCGRHGRVATPCGLPRSAGAWGRFLEDGCLPTNKRCTTRPIPEFEIDAQAVQWSQYVEFVEDGGYDDPRWWTESGWSWVVEQERRAPRYVEQLSRGVLVQRQGQVQRVATAQAVMHVSWHEAMRLVPLGRPAFADRGGVGARGVHGRLARVRLGRCGRVDGRARGGGRRRCSHRHAPWPRRRSSRRSRGARCICRHGCTPQASQGPARNCVRRRRVVCRIPQLRGVIVDCVGGDFAVVASRGRRRAA